LLQTKFLKYGPVAALYINMVMCESFNLVAVTFIIAPVVFL
jgi:hypothetical protein